YTAIAPFLDFSPQQTTALITVMPKLGVVLSNGVESVQIALKPDPSYVLATPSSGLVLIVNQTTTFGAWQQQYFPTNSDPASVFATADPGHQGIPVLLR